MVVYRILEIMVILLFLGMDAMFIATVVCAFGKLRHGFLGSWTLYFAGGAIVLTEVWLGFGRLSGILAHHARSDWFFVHLASAVLFMGSLITLRFFVKGTKYPVTHMWIAIFCLFAWMDTNVLGALMIYQMP